MARIIGIGGVFYKADDPAGTAAFYHDIMGMPKGDGFHGSILPWARADDPSEQEMTVFSMFSTDTDYMKPSDKPLMVNFITDDLDGMLAKLKAANIEIVGDIAEESYGRFAWFIDPSGAKMELWQPTKPTE